MSPFYEASCFAGSLFHHIFIYDIRFVQYTDQLNRTIELHEPPKRIVSLVPSQSELLWDLGLREEIAGITKFCVHPEEMFRTVTRVGGTKMLNFGVIRHLNPDLVIGNKEENEKSQVEQLMKEFKVWMSDIHNQAQALDMIGRIGELTSRQQQSHALAADIASGFKQLRTTTATRNNVLYLIWKDPYMAAGRDTFISDMLNRMGLQNSAQRLPGRYPEITLQAIRDLHPDHIFLSSEPYPFKESHMQALKALLPNTTITLVDGEMFSWYGSRMKKAPQYLQGLIDRL